MDGKARIRIEPGGADRSDEMGEAGEASDASGPDWSGPGASSHRRVVHEPTRWTRAAAVVVLAGVLVGGLVLSLGGRGADPDGDPDEPPPLDSPDNAYIAAVSRLGRARSFAYSGTVHATERSVFRPGTMVGEGGCPV